jgi:hypothetical protein
MKNILTLIIVFIASLTFSQGTVTAMKSNYSLISDTVVNTGTAYVQVQSVKVNYQMAVQAVVTKLTGTVAGYTLLQGSLDGTNFLDLNTDTLTNTNQTTNTKIWIIDGNPYLYYRLLVTGIGTMTATVKGSLLSSGKSSDKHVLTNLKSTSNKTSDTIVNTATEYLTLNIANSYKNVVIQPVVTKISGTAGGTVTLQGSIDGINYVTVSSSYSNYQTLSVANQTTNTKLFVVTGSPYFYYRLKYAGTGTMSCKLFGYVLPSNDDLR